jgi:FkbM family methyltransferase
MFFTKRNREMIISAKETRRLHAIPRYSPTEVIIFGKKIIVNDSCTLLCDLDEILEKEIYKFETESSVPLIIDCGANIGISTIYFKRLYPKAKIIAFEPDPVLFSMLSKNISNFSFENIEIHQAAIWTNDHGVSFLQEGGHSGKVLELGGHDNKISVSSFQLKKILNFFESIDMLKIDIEGAEFDVLFDCGEYLSKCKNVFVEYHSDMNKKQKLHNILELMCDIGYRYHIHESFKRKHPFVDRQTIAGMDLQLNLFFFKENISYPPAA